MKFCCVKVNEEFEYKGERFIKVDAIRAKSLVKKDTIPFGDNVEVTRVVYENWKNLKDFNIIISNEELCSLKNKCAELENKIEKLREKVKKYENIICKNCEKINCFNHDDCPLLNGKDMK